MKKFRETNTLARKTKGKRFGNRNQQKQERNKMFKRGKTNKLKRKEKYENINKIIRKRKVRKFNEKDRVDSDEMDNNSDIQTNRMQINEKPKERVREPVSNTIPWISVASKESTGLVKLHNEIKEFYDLIRPKADQNKLRIDTFQMIKRLINKSFREMDSRIIWFIPSKCASA